MTKKKDKLAKGIFRNPATGVKLNTSSHANITQPDIEGQGYKPFGAKQVKGGSLFSQRTDKDKEYQEFVQRPKGWTPSGTPTPAKHDTTYSDAQKASGGTPEEQFAAGQAAIGGAGAGTNIPYSNTLDTKPKPPSFLSGLPGDEEAVRQDELDSTIKSLQDASVKELAEIRAAGERTIGASKGFLSKIGALGRTISGAPVDTNLGVLSFQNNLIEDAIKEEEANLQKAIAGAKEGSRLGAEKRVEALNKLMQTNFDNALKLLKEDREMRGEDRADKLADLQIDQLNFDIAKANRTLNKENMEDALEDITRMAESGIPLDQLSLETIMSLEQTAGLPSGTFEAFYQAEQDAKAIANEENITRVEKMKQDIYNSIESLEIQRRNANTSAYSASISAQNLALNQEKFAFEKIKENGGPVDTIEQFAANYGESKGMSIGADSPEVEEAYSEYVEWQKAENLLKEIQSDPTSMNKDYLLAGGEEKTGMTYAEWYGKFKLSLEDIVARQQGIIKDGR